MANSTIRVEDDEWHDAEFCPSGVVPGKLRVLTAQCESGRMIHHERMYDADGNAIYDQKFPMDYVIGSGQRAKAYVHRRGDLLFMSPLNWYRETSVWDLSPNYEPDDVRRFDRRVNEACLGCHSGRVAVQERGTNRYADPLFHETRIGCEKCHGPGEEHIAFREGITESDIDPIVNPAKLEHMRRESVCYQCHLSTKARFLRPGRSHLDFRPGMKLSEIWAILDRGIDISKDGRTRSVNHVQQMRASRCYQMSSPKMGCITCHDPHRETPLEFRLAFYRERCLQCHEESDCRASRDNRLLRQDSCIECHMPSLESSNMDHVAQTDHRILRDPESEGRFPMTEHSHPLEFFADMGEELPEQDRKRAVLLGSFLDRSLPPDRLARNLEELLSQFPEDGLVLSALGILARQRNELSAARRYFELAAAIPSERESSLFELLQLSYQSKEWSAAVDYATRLLEIDPFDTRVYAILGDSLWSLGRAEEAIDAVRRASELNPGSLPLREWLIDRYRRTGRNEELREEELILGRLREARIPKKISEMPPD
ncbi:MAG TPA: tetratricopeptide repeat protein [Planctomycetaceae bacterium]|nr:tetratricopeptide repeat protein [Planctomycetaceae bacterium]